MCMRRSSRVACRWTPIWYGIVRLPSSILLLVLVQVRAGVVVVVVVISSD